MLDSLVSQSDQESQKAKPEYCPRFLKFKYVDGHGMKVEPTPSMLNGAYFEWHLLGATRDGVEPVLPRIGVKDQRPTKSASKQVMIDYITSKDAELAMDDTGLLKSLTVPALFSIIENMPVDLSPGNPSTLQLRIDEVVKVARQVLRIIGIDPAHGQKQLHIQTEEEEGHIDWLTDDIKNLGHPAIYDVKFTQTKVDDWRNGWGEPEQREDIKTQAAHYIYLYHEEYGEWIPFYYLIFGESGWIKIIRVVLTEQGLQVHKINIAATKELISKFEKSKWAARPEFNRCLECPFAEMCDKRALLPEVQEIEI